MSFSPGAVDFRTLLLRIKNDNSKNLFIVAQNEYPNIIRQLNELGINKQIFATPVFHNTKFIKDIGVEQSEGIIYCYYGIFDNNNLSSHSKNFSKKYNEMFSSSPSYYAALAYDNISILFHAIEMAGSTHVDSIKKSLYKINNFEGVTGRLSFDQNGDVKKPVILKTVKNGQFTNLAY